MAQIEIASEPRTVTIREPQDELHKQTSVEEKPEEARELDIVEEIDPRDFLDDVPEQLAQINEAQDQGTYRENKMIFSSI